MVPNMKKLNVRFKQLLGGEIETTAATVAAVLKFGDYAHPMPGLPLPIERRGEFGGVGPAPDGYLAPQPLDKARVVLVWQLILVLLRVFVIGGQGGLRRAGIQEHE